MAGFHIFAIAGDGIEESERIKEVWHEGEYMDDEGHGKVLEEDQRSMDTELFMDIAPERLSLRAEGGRFSAARFTTGGRTTRGRSITGGRMTAPSSTGGRQSTVRASFKRIPAMERTSGNQSAVRLDTGPVVVGSAALLQRLGRSEHGEQGVAILENRSDEAVLFDPLFSTELSEQTSPRHRSRSCTQPQSTKTRARYDDSEPIAAWTKKPKKDRSKFQTAPFPTSIETRSFDEIGSSLPTVADSLQSHTTCIETAFESLDEVATTTPKLEEFASQVGVPLDGMLSEAMTPGQPNTYRTSRPLRPAVFHTAS